MSSSHKKKTIQLRSRMRFLQSCRICSKGTYYSYYGCIVCDACRTFFRRQVLLAALNNKKLSCPLNEQCKIVSGSRSNCTYCRFQKCILFGMRPELVNLKHGIEVESANKSKCIATSVIVHAIPGPSLKSVPVTEESSQTCLSDLAKDRFSCSNPDYKPLNHLWLKRPQHSKLQYKVVSAEEIPCYLFKVVLQVKVKDGVIVGTNCYFNDLIKKNSVTTKDHIRDDDLIFETRKQSLKFQKFEQQVRVIDISKHDSILVLRNMDNHLWSRLKQLKSASKFFHDSFKVQYSLPKTDFVENLNNNSSTDFKDIELSTSMYQYLNCMTAGIEVFEIFQSLPTVDQVILLKNGIITTVVLINVLIQDKDNDVEVYSAFDDNLLFGIHFDTTKSDPDAEIAGRVYQELIREMLPCLKEDAFAMSLICMVFFFHNHHGVTEGDTILNERNMFVQLLEKYVEGKIEAGHWSVSLQDVLANIDSWNPLVSKLNESYLLFSNTIEKRMQNYCQKDMFI